MFTVADVIDDVRSAHPAFDNTRVPDTVIRTACRTYQVQLRGRIAGRDKTKLAVTQTIPMPTTIDVTVPLPDLPKLLYVVGGEVVTQGIFPTQMFEREPLIIVSLARRPYAGRSVTLIGDQLFLNGSQTSWLPEVVEIDVNYVAEAAPLENRRSPFSLPNDAQPTMSAFASKLAAQRAAAYGAKVDPSFWNGEFTRMETEYLKTLRWSQRSRVTTMRDGNGDDGGE